MKPRGAGSVYERGRVWWLKYYDRNGWVRRESSHSKLKGDAEKLLRQRLGDVASGKRYLGSDLERTRFEDLATIIKADWQANNRRSQERLKIAFNHLATKFAGWRARDIDFGELQAYRATRQREDGAQATIRWELGALRTAFRLAARDGRAECPQFPRIVVANTRQGFFEAKEWQAIRAHLRPEFQDVGDFAYLTGWRIMEVLTLRWQQIDFNAGTIRLEPDTTKTGVGRPFPFAEYQPLRAVIERRRAQREEIQRAAQIITPWVFFFHARGQFHRIGDPVFLERKRRPSWAFRDGWNEAAIAAGFPGRIPHDFRRTAARNMERAGIPRSVAKALGGWKSDSMYNRYTIASEADLRDGVRRLSIAAEIAGKSQR